MEEMHGKKRSRNSKTLQTRKLQKAASLLAAGVLKIGEAASLVGLPEETVAHHLYRSGKPRRQPGRNAVLKRRRNKLQELEQLLAERHIPPAEIRKLLNLTRAEYNRCIDFIQRRRKVTPQTDTIP